MKLPRNEQDAALIEATDTEIVIVAAGCEFRNCVTKTTWNT